MSEYVYATTSCVVGWNGTRVRLEKGQTWQADDPFVKDRPEFFATSPTVVIGSRGPQQDVVAPVEQATNAPGEKRATRRVGKSAE